MGKFSVREIFKNLILNFLSYAFPTVVLQFVVQPLVANRLGADLNGEYLTLMSLNYFMIGITAAVLNTVRMLQNDKYAEHNVVGDFNLIFLLYALLLIVAMPIGYLFYTKTPSGVDILLYVCIGILYLYHDYIFAQYRLRMQFNKIVISNGILVIGYFGGIVAFWYAIQKWQLIFIISYALSGIYDYFNTDFIREPIKKTPLLRETMSKAGSLMVANALNSSITYFDKLLLYPLLGGIAVSIYSTASLVGKMLLLVSSPLNSLLLSYLVKMESFRLSELKKHAGKIIGFLALGYVLCVVVGYPLTNYLYPAWASDSHRYIPITVAANLFLLVGNLINTIIIRYYKTSIQMIIQSFNLGLYLVASLTLLHFWGLLGFSIGVAIVAGIKMIILLVLVGKLDGKSSALSEKAIH